MSEIHKVGSLIETASGRFFSFDAPEFHIEDIAVHLGRIKRYTGACQEYSVAEHCWHVSHLCRDPFEGLMHDAPEFAIGDMASPLKRRPELAGFRSIEDRLWIALAACFGLNQIISDDTHYWDNAVAYMEADWLLPSGGRHWPDYAAHQHLLGTREFHCWDGSTAAQKFLERYHQLICKQPISTPRVFKDAFQEVFNG